MTDQRKLQALRNLAERPGTAAEGETARAMLAKLEAKAEVELNDFESDWENQEDAKAFACFSLNTITFAPAPQPDLKGMTAEEFLFEKFNRLRAQMFSEIYDRIKP